MNGTEASRPSWWYIVLGVAFMLGGAGLFVYFLFTGIFHLTESLTQIVVPGEKELTFANPGTYVVFLERQSVVDGRIYSTTESVSGLRCTVQSQPGNQEIPVRRANSSITYSVGGRSGRAALAFDLKEGGQYLFSCAYPPEAKGPQLVVAVGEGVAHKIEQTVVRSLAAMFAGFGIGGAMIFIFVRRREKAKRAALGRPPNST